MTFPQCPSLAGKDYSARNWSGDARVIGGKSRLSVRPVRTNVAGQASAGIARLAAGRGFRGHENRMRGVSSADWQ